jgi:hypothetical protein
MVVVKVCMPGNIIVICGLVIERVAFSIVLLSLFLVQNHVKTVADVTDLDQLMVVHQ